MKYEPVKYRYGIESYKRVSFYNEEETEENLVGRVCCHNGDNRKGGGRMSDKKLINIIEKKISPPPRNLSNREIYDSFCVEYGKAIGPKIEAVDRHQARSMEKAFTKVIR